MKFNALIPELKVASLQDSLSFYKSLLGFEILYDRPENKFAFLSLQSAQLMLEEVRDNEVWTTAHLEHPYGRGINFQFSVEDVESIASRLSQVHYPLRQPLEVAHYRMGNEKVCLRQFLVLDPDGYLLRFAQFISP